MECQELPSRRPCKWAIPLISAALRVYRPKITKADADYFSTHWGATTAANRAYNDARAFANRLAPDVQGDNALFPRELNGPVDAIRHATGACMLKRARPRDAEVILANHETGATEQTEAAATMDRNNNAVGIANAASEGDCGALAAASYSRGDLTTIWK